METAHSLQQIQSSYIREILQAACDENIISLAGGLPDKSTFPTQLIRPAMEKLAGEVDIFQYGNTDGYPPLLSLLRDKYQLADNHKALVCTGSQQALDLLARAFINPGDNIVMEAPSYLGAMQVFGLCQANILTVPQLSNGPDLDALETQFSQSAVKLFYAVPDFHNPTGVCWSLEVRKKVAELCIRYDVTLVEDAPYRELRFSGDELPMVSEFCPDKSIVLRSFSKIASPGLRLGVATGAANYIDPMIKVKQGADLHSSVPMQALLLELISQPEFDHHLSSTQQLYKARYQKLMREIEGKLGDKCQVNPVQGGMFVWLTLPQSDTMSLAKNSLEKGVAVVPSKVFYPEGSPQSSALRLNFTNASDHELELAVERLSEVIGSVS
ncbi:aminotransferase-like domain-containing protein [Vibrio sp. SCSIO 43137]|uniref:aminotransferase-like domain-containing protein n=1 Tax=Vibrio sp. SCSIO 43137 TaxID=3021011 RepID=UPI00230796F3|nr:PLP-dependent aminotransferase family protein [Vibrio sp. SCSIO 43137]WCE32339.1 PLP-dependent aminotransferase family protein [Vibrio sp. SCSIO 43137]